MADPAAGVPESAGDMRDSADEIAFWNLLALEACHPILDAFDVVDAKALRHQKVHRQITLIAAVSGGLAVLCAIWELGFDPVFPSAAPVFVRLETIALFCTAVALLWGWGYRHKDKWLINRHQAELFRLMRFEFLIHPDVWAGGRAAASDWVRRRIGEVSALHGRLSLERSTERALQISEYYLEKRLSPQKEFLANRAQRNAFWDGWLVRHVTPALLTMSVMAALTQLAINELHLAPAATEPVTGCVCPLEDQQTFWNVAFVTLGAASLPVVAAMIRTLRLAFEFSRNRSRFLAAHDALTQIEVRLVHRLAAARTTEPGPTETSLILGDLRMCEQVLRTEHQEWLRLMLEAEWFG